MNTQKDLCDLLEEQIDKHSVSEVLNALSNVCFEKSEHLKVTWQDKNAAKCWEERAITLMNLADSSEMRD